MLKKLILTVLFFALAGCGESLMQSDNKLDAVIAAPKSHKILLENDRVRVLEVVIQPGEKEPAHTHSLPSVMHVDEPSQIQYYDAEGKMVFDSRTSDKPRTSPTTSWLEPEGLHAVENVGDKPFHAIRVELKK
jgi:predicted metal-dependent enzyme (double-stranded beta helix superfamily)